MSLYLCVSLSVTLFYPVGKSVCLSLSLSVCLSVCLYLSFFLSFCLCVSFSQSVSLSISLSLVFLSLSDSDSLFLFGLSRRVFFISFYPLHLFYHLSTQSSNALDITSHGRYFIGLILTVVIIHLP